jgi:hypothetical protein
VRVANFMPGSGALDINCQLRGRSNCGSRDVTHERPRVSEMFLVKDLERIDSTSYRYWAYVNF